MNNKIDFKVRCPIYPYREETIRVIYVKNEGRWFPLPPNGCDNYNCSRTCAECQANLISLALQTFPRFAE